MTLHPAFAAYLDELNVLVAKSRDEGVEPTAASAREALASLNRFAEPSTPVARIFEARIGYSSDSGAVEVPVRVYVPRPEEPSDVIVFVHGGGHMAGDLDVYDFSARRTAAATGMVVVSVDYRRSPETPFPGGLTDTYHVVSQLEEVLAGAVDVVLGEPVDVLRARAQRHLGPHVVALAGLATMWRSGRRLLATGASLVIGVMMLVGVSVFDISRSVGFIFPIVPVALLAMRPVERSWKESLLWVAAAVSLLWPLLYAADDQTVVWEYPLPLWIVDWAMNG